MAPTQVSDQCQIVLGILNEKLGPYPLGRTLRKRGVQCTRKHMRIFLLGTLLSWFEINLQLCWASPKGVVSTWHMFATIAHQRCNFY